MTEAALAWAAERLGGPIADVRPLLGGQTSTMLALTEASGARAVLRLIDREPWRHRGDELAGREAQVLRQLAGSGVPAPRSLALDAAGAHCGVAAHLMALLPGAVDTDRVSESDLDQLAGALATIHDIRVDPMPRTYQPWAFEAKYVVPTWSAHPGAWAHAFAVLRRGAPSYEPAFLHRDPHLRNVLWDGSTLSGVVDWVETSTGPAWLDVAHCRTNLAVDHGSDVADAFAAAYVERTSRDPAPYWDLLDAVGFLPPPGVTHFSSDPARLARLDDHLAMLVERGS